MVAVRCEFCRGGRAPLPLPRSAVSWSIRHRVKCSPRESNGAGGLRPATEEKELSGEGRGTAVCCHLGLHL